MNFLDKTGLNYLIGKLKDLFSEIGHNHDNDYLKRSGDTLSNPLMITGGDSATSGCLKMSPNGNGQITDNNTSTLLGFFGNSASTTQGTQKFYIGTGTYPTQIRSKDKIWLETKGSNTDSPVGVISTHSSECWIGLYKGGGTASSNLLGYFGVTGGNPHFYKGGNIPLIMGDKSYKIVTSSTAPTSADANTITIVTG